MSIERRHFLTMAAALGVSALVTPWAVRSARAATSKLWILVTASGAWDPRFHFDPTVNVDQNRLYTGIGKAGALSYADWAVDLAKQGLDANPDYNYAAWLMSPGDFVKKHGAKLTVLNGIDTSTNNHDTGQRVVSSGAAAGTLPSIAALVAATSGTSLPISYFSGGGYDATAGLVPLTRLSGPDTARRLAQPNVIDPNNPDSAKYHTDETWQRIRAAQNEGLAELAAGQHLPKLRKSMDDFAAARLSDSQLAKLVLPTTQVEIPGYQLGDLRSMLRQCQLAVAAMKSGLTVSANIVLGGFDTHGNHDRDQSAKQAKLFYGVDYLIGELTAAGLMDRTVVAVVSDFARGPHYNGTNDNAGKDHWPVTSALVLGAGVQGNRVIGSTDDKQLALPIDPATLKPVAKGTVLTPGIVHKALRKLAGVDPALDARFPLQGAEVPLFG